MECRVSYLINQAADMPKARLDDGCYQVRALLPNDAGQISLLADHRMSAWMIDRHKQLWVAILAARGSRMCMVSARMHLLGTCMLCALLMCGYGQVWPVHKTNKTCLLPHPAKPRSVGFIFHSQLAVDDHPRRYANLSGDQQAAALCIMPLWRVAV